MNSDGAVGMIHMQENGVLQGVFFPSICISSSQYFQHSDNLHLFCYYYLLLFRKANTPNGLHTPFPSFYKHNPWCFMRKSLVDQAE